MDLKFYLNKFVRAQEIEHYTLKTITDLKKCYDKFIEKTEGYDPDFPETDFSGGKGKKGQKIGGVNKTKVDEALGEETGDLGRVGGYDDTRGGLEQRKAEMGDRIRNPNLGRTTKGRR